MLLEPSRTRSPHSARMARIRAVNTRPEVSLRGELATHGVRYEPNLIVEGGEIDIALPSERIAVFVDGCFWHGCPKHYRFPQTNAPYWSRKLERNFARDRSQTLTLRRVGWRVFRVWEHEIRKDLQAVVAAIIRFRAARLRTRLPSWRVIRVECCPEHPGQVVALLQTLVGKKRSSSPAR